MHVQFSVTLDDFVDLTLRAYRQSPSYRWLHWPVGAVGALIVAWMSLRGGSMSLGSVSAAIVSAAFALALYHFFTRWISAQAARSNCRPIFATTQSLLVEVTVDDESLLFRQGGNEARYAWNNVVAAVDTPGAVEIRGPHGLVGAVRDRAFTDGTERAQFIRAVNARATGIKRT